MERRAPKWMDSVDDLSDTARFAAMTPNERLEIFVEVCDLAHSILSERPDAEEVLARSEPLEPAAEQTWLRLVSEARRAREAR